LLFRSAAPKTAPLAPAARGVTRRRLLATGGAAGAAAAFGGLRPLTASAAEPSVPDYLGRSSYAHLSAPTFAVGTTTLTLEQVADLGGDPKLAGSEDAFSLLFSAAAPLQPAIQAFSHPDLGQFEFFIAPVERSGMYEVVVNRSVNAPKHVPRAPAAHSGPGPAAPPKPGAKPPHVPHVRAPPVKRVTARRLARGFACGIGLTPDSKVKSAVVWVSRGGLVVASAEVRHVHGDKLNVRIPTRHRPKGGRYTITVRTKDRHGHVDYRVVKLTLA
jgi:hypothetical protein